MYKIELTDEERELFKVQVKKCINNVRASIWESNLTNEVCFYHKFNLDSLNEDLEILNMLLYKLSNEENAVTKTSEFKSYKKTQLTDIRPYDAGYMRDGYCRDCEDFDFEAISVDAALLREGHPKIGDMVCRDPNNHADQWLITEKYFNDNYSNKVDESVKETGHIFDSYFYCDRVVYAAKHKIGDPLPEGFENFILSASDGDIFGNIMLAEGYVAEDLLTYKWFVSIKDFKKDFVKVRGQA